MTTSTDVLDRLKKAANYSKLALHQEGPAHYTRGAGALVKVLVKFGDNGTLTADRLAELLDWDKDAVQAKAEKAAKEGLVTLAEVDGVCTATVTGEGRSVMAERFEQEDKAADEITAALSEDEKRTLSELCNKISDQCAAMGVDYGKIAWRPKKECGCKAKKAKKDEKDEKPKKDKKAKKADKSAKDVKKASKKDGAKIAKAAKKTKKAVKKAKKSKKSKK